MNGDLIGLFLVLIVIGVFVYEILWEEKRMSKMTGKKVRNLKTLREEFRREEAKQQHAAETAAKRARRAKAHQETMENAETIRDLVDNLDRDARTSYILSRVPTIRVCENEPYPGTASPGTVSQHNAEA